MTIRGVILDLGHTLMLLDGTWPEVFEHSMSDLAAFVEGQIPGIDGSAFAQAWMGRRQDAWALARDTMRETTATDCMRWTFARFGIPDPDPHLVRQAIWASFQYEDGRWRAHPQAQEVLSQLSARGLRLGLYSNATDDWYIQYLVDRFGFRPFLNPVLSSAGTGIRKPDPSAFVPISVAWSQPPQSVVVVGDSLEDDILGAQRASMRSVWIRSRLDGRQEGRPVSQHAPLNEIVSDRVIADLGELPGCLDDMQ